MEVGAKHLTEEEVRERRVVSIMKKIQENNDIPADNRKAARQWMYYLEARGVAKNTIIKHLYSLERFLVFLPKGVLLSKATREDVQAAVARLERENYSPETKHNIKVIAKAFFKHTLGDDEFYPKQVSWIKNTLNKNRKKMPDVLTEEEVLKMIGSVSSPRDKAIIAVLYDSGVRVGELLSMKIGDIDLNSEPAHIIVDGKTGMRRIPVYFCAPYLVSYMQTLINKKQQDHLWIALGSWSNINYKIKESGVRKVLKDAAKKAGIEKRMYPHLFRHSRATNYANKLTEQQLKVFFGWTGDSKMVSTYVHLSGRDIDDAVLQANGLKSKDHSERSMLTVKVCPRCRESNPMSFVHCSRCGAALDISTAMKQEEITMILETAGAEEQERKLDKKKLSRRVKKVIKPID